MEKLEKELIQTLEKEAKKLKNDPVILEFDKADKEFSKLVDEGLAKRRGNNQMPVDQIHLRRYSFNTPI
ncbi:MAG: hypothetical protein GX612_03300 [Bacteroidales bacterium]|nr:hypothetical protein [Bacteroidales bacterium]